MVLRFGVLLGAVPQALVGLLVDVPCLLDGVLVLQAELKLGQRQPNFDMLSLGQKPPVEVSRAIRLLLLHLEVDVRLPQDLRHVQPRLGDGQLIDGASSLGVTCKEWNRIVVVYWSASLLPNPKIRVRSQLTSIHFSVFIP